MQKLPLQSGITIRDHRMACSSEGPKILLSSGTRSSRELIDPDQYGKDAYVPKLPWRKPSEAELCLLTGRSIDHRQFVSLVRLPDNLLVPFDTIRDALRRGESEESLREISRTQTCAAGVGGIIRDLEGRGADPFHRRAGISVRSSGLVTCSYDPEARAYIGIHVDSFFHNEIEKRSSSPNRICVNLGIEERSLLFINLPLSKISRILAENGCNDPRSKDPGKGLAVCFFTAFPDYPVVRVALAPGDAYIAPTENMIHDGTTAENSSLDILLTILGNFDEGLYR